MPDLASTAVSPAKSVARGIFIVPFRSLLVVLPFAFAGEEALGGGLLVVGRDGFGGLFGRRWRGGFVRGAGWEDDGGGAFGALGLEGGLDLLFALQKRAHGFAAGGGFAAEEEVADDRPVELDAADADVERDEAGEEDEEEVGDGAGAFA